MERDFGASAMHGVEDPRSRKGRLMGKIFGGRDRRGRSDARDDGASGDDIDAFLHGSSNATADFSSPRSSTATRPSFDSFQASHAAPPLLAKLDTRSISRYPNAAAVVGSSQSSAPVRGPTKAPRPGTKDLVVRFANNFPDIIGEGGEESDIPTIEISKRKRLATATNPPVAQLQIPNVGPGPRLSPRPLPLRSPVPPFASPAVLPQQQRSLGGDDDFVPGPIRRTQTGFSSTPDASPQQSRNVSPVVRGPPPPEKVSAGRPAPAPFLGAPVMGRDEKRRSFIEIHQAEMGKAEALALKADRDGVSPPSSPDIDKNSSYSPARRPPKLTTPSPPLPPPKRPQHVESPQVSLKSSEPSPILPSPSPKLPPDAMSHQPDRYVLMAANLTPPPLASPTVAVHRALNAFRQNSSGRLSGRDRDDDAASVSTMSPRSPVNDLHSVVQAAADDAFNTFVNRSRHLFELFRLQSETVRPLLSTNAEDLVRAALWWFIIGRMGLESAFRARSARGTDDSTVSRSNEFAMQQAYADVAKAYWLVGEILPDVPNVDGQVEHIRTALLYNLRKLSVSMQRNNLLPPEDAFLPQTVDKTIWAKYAPVSSDITALLWGYWSSSLSMPQPLSPPMAMLEALPMSDSAQDFVFSRMWADVFLLEQSRDSSSRAQPQFRFPCLLSIARPLNSAMLELVLSSQNGAVQLRVRGKKNMGPTWDDVRWRADVQSLELILPRGFLLAIQLSEQDFGLLWSMYDFGSKVHSQLYPRPEEVPLFRTTLKAFQFFEVGQPTGSFPKEAVPDCDVALFEKLPRVVAATGPRQYHRGFRIAVVSGTLTRTLYGLSHTYLPDTPLQFSFLRGDLGDPALLLRFENSRSKGNMVLTFASGDERIRLHSLLAGTALHRDEQVVADVPVASWEMRMASRALFGGGGGPNSGNAALGAFRKLAFKRVRIINADDNAGDTCAPTVLAEKLRMVLEFGDCTIVDRINVAPGELKIRLDVRDTTCMMILRQPQLDMTVAVSDVQVPKEVGRDLADALRVTKGMPTYRVLHFASSTDLHAVQKAITGFRVMFDGIAATFAIARRRLVVPIHKKWEAGATRIQIVMQPEGRVVQLLAFFHDFHYGHCLSFVLKGTDVFEVFGRGNKAGVKFDDAKFPLPRVSAGDSEGGSDGGSSGGGDGRGVEARETAYVCLDLPDLPGEHDDISIIFDSEAVRDQMVTCLPAQARTSRLTKKF